MFAPENLATLFVVPPVRGHGRYSVGRNSAWQDICYCGVVASQGEGRCRQAASSGVGGLER